MVAANGAVVDDDICERKQNASSLSTNNTNGMSFTWRVVAGKLGASFGTPL
jgi:hypothetical protein